jgi:sulfotransferase
MEKTFHFLSGLPRSGNTLLSAILNQNPSIYTSSLSPVTELMWNFLESSLKSEHIARNENNTKRAEVFLSSFISQFYKGIEKPVIIDREKDWGTPDNLNIIKQFITPKPKIIFTVRDILEIIASFVRMDAPYLKAQVAINNNYINNYRSEQDMIAEHLMGSNNHIDKSLLSLSSAFLKENKGIFHIVEYNDLIAQPEKTMDGIYTFLEMPKYEHNFREIERIEKDNDEALGFPKDLHEIRKSLSKSSTSTDILSDYIKHKYSNMEFWRDGSLMKVKGKDF